MPKKKKNLTFVMSFSRLLCGILHPPFVCSANCVRQNFFRLQESKFACSKYKTIIKVYNFEPTSVAKRHQEHFPLIIPLRLLRREPRMAKLAKAIEGQKSLDNGNEEGVVSSSSGFLSGDEDVVIPTKGKGRGRKAKKEAIKEVDTIPPENAEKPVKAVGTARGRKKLSNDEEIANAINSLDNEVKVQKKPAAAAKGRGKKAATEEHAQVVENISAETTEVVAPAKRGRKAALAKVVETSNENNAEIDVASAPKGRGKGKKVTAVPAADNKEPTAVQPIAEGTNTKQKRQKKSTDEIPKDEVAKTVEIVKEDKKKKVTKSTKVKAEPIESTNGAEPEAIVDVKKTKAKGRQPKKEEIVSNNESEPVVEKVKSRGRQSKQEQKEVVVKNLLEKSTEKTPVKKTASKRKATNKEPVADSLIENNAEELNVEKKEEDSKPTANKISKKEPKEKKPAKETKPKARAAKTQKNVAEEELENGVTEEDKEPKGRKRAAAVADDDEVDEVDGAKPAKAKKAKAPLMNATATKYNKEDFILPPKEDGVERFNLKISSWNVAGLRSWLNKDGLRYLDYESPDIFCLQEIKCTIDQLPEEVARIPGYHPYWLCMPGGYAGVAIYSKIMPINVVYGINNEEFDGAGRMITAEYEKFFLINVYVPNSGRKLVNLEARMRWEKLFQEYVKRLDAIKPVVICGDMNVSHQAIDLANPKTNTRSAGFTQEERDKMTELLALGFVDTFRHFYPDRIGAYTYWTYMANARSRNVGWRLDYYIVSERFTKRVVDNCIRAQVMGSDHCPITLFLKI